MFTMFDWVNLLALLWDEFVAGCPKASAELSSLRFFRNQQLQDM